VQDFCETACSSSGDILPAPGISLSITYLGMIVLLKLFDRIYTIDKI